MSGAYTKQEQTLPLSLSHILVKQHKTQVGSVAETSLLHRLSSTAYAFQQNGGRERGWGKMYCFCFCLFVCFSFCLSLFVFGYGYFAFAFVAFVIFTCFFVLLFCCSLFVFAFGYFAFALLYFITTNLLQSLNNLCKSKPVLHIPAFICK